MKRVDKQEVVQYWLERELAKRGQGPVSSELDPDAAVGALLQEEPGAADVIWRDHPVGWYRVEVTRERLAQLELIAGPSNLLWRALASDGRVMTAARRVSQESPTELERESGVDIDTILEYRQAVADGLELDPLVLNTRQGCAPWYVVDGNHRATALALHLIETGTYEPHPAYLIISSNSVVRPAVERVCGLVQRFFGRRI